MELRLFSPATVIAVRKPGGLLAAREPPHAFSVRVDGSRSNRGNAAAGRSVLTIANVGTFTVPALAAGGSATFSWST